MKEETMAVGATITTQHGRLCVRALTPFIVLTAINLLRARDDTLFKAGQDFHCLASHVQNRT
jgi:hypothetical protein